MTAGPAPLTPVPIVVKMPPPIMVPSPMATKSFAVSARRRILRVPSSRSFSASVVAKSSEKNDTRASLRSSAPLPCRRLAGGIPDVLGNAKHVVDPTRPNKERIREPIEVAQRLERRLLVVIDERDQEALGAAADRSCEVELRTWRRAARMDELRKRREFGLGFVDRALERRDVCRTNRWSTFAPIFGRRSELAAEIEKRILDPGQPRVEVKRPGLVLQQRAQRGARDADGARELIDRSVRFDAERALFDPPSAD